MSVRSRQDQSGQVIAIYAFAALLLAFITFLTLSVGTRVREKIKVQATADAAAYGLAVAQARTFNTMAWGNRAIVAEYVSMLSMVGHGSYLNYWENSLKAAGDNYSTIQKELVAQCIACILTKCGCPACGCVKAAGTASKRFKSDSFPGAPSCPGGGPGKFGSYACAHYTWHTGPRAKNLHQLIEGGAKGYVGLAGAVEGVMASAARRYHDQLAAPSQGFAGATATAVDPNLTAPSLSGTSANQAAFRRALTGHFKPIPGPLGVPDVPSAAWDSYHEILVGTRTGWIRQHAWKGGVWTAVNAAATADMLKCRAIASCSANDSGGAMTQIGDYGQEDAVNHRTGAHQYNTGSGTEGGRHAASAEDHGTTRCGAYIVGSCAGGYASRSVGRNRNYLFLSTNPGCDQKSYHLAADGFSDGDQQSPASKKWITGVSSSCSGTGPGISTGFVRFNLPTSPSAGKAEKVLWNQPRTYAKLQKDLSTDWRGVTSDGRAPWEFNLDKLGGSLLTTGAANPTGGGSMPAGAGKTLQTTGFGNRYDQVRGYSAGLTYYHNPKSWEEYPNTWNPFWRAKLDQPFAFGNDLDADDKAAAQELGYTP
jgi:hypothetical protein